MQTRILFFGRLRDAAGASERIVKLPDNVTNVDSLISFLTEGDVLLRNALTAPEIRIAINEKIIPSVTSIDKPTEIAFMPAFSGG